MPDFDDANSVSVTVPVPGDSLGDTSYHTLKVVVIKKMDADTTNGSSFGIILGPLIIITIIAGIILFFLSRVKNNPNTNRILDRLENAAGIIDRDIERGKL